MNERVSYWLMPAAPERAWLSEMIQGFAARVNGPVFEPHLTLYSGPVESPARINEIMAEAARETSAKVLHTTGLSHSDQFTKTLFVEFAEDAALTHLMMKLKQLSAFPEDYELKPHLSLIYASLPQAQRETLARSILLPKVIRFDSLKAVLTGTSVVSPADVEAWRALGEESLA
jgi:hypothetical protein